MSRQTTTVATVATVALSLWCQAAAAQAPLAAGIPRTADGKPDFNGVWQVLNTAAWDLQDHHADTGVPPGAGVVVGGEIPYQPWALERKKQNYANRLTEDTDAKCFLSGVPRLTYMPYPFRIVQNSEKLTFLHEYIHTTRHIYTNGTEHPRGPIEWWLGDSRGRWESDTLVVDVIHFTDQTRFDKAGNFHSEALHVVERLTFIDADHIDYDVTIEDPKVFRRPWKIRMPLYRRIESNPRVLEYDCYAFTDVFRLPS